MAYLAGCQFPANPGFASDDGIFPDILETARGVIASGIVNSGVGEDGIFVALAGPGSEPGGDVIRKVILGAQGAKQVFRVGVSPGLGDALVGIRGFLDWHAGGKGDAGHGCIHAEFLKAQVGGETQILFAEIHTDM